jgi:transcriptional regulator with XRE-family HTH domain
MNSFAKRLTQVREAKGLSRYKLAQMAGTSTENISNLEEGNDPRLSTVVKLAEALECTPAELVHDEAVKSNGVAATSTEPVAALLVYKPGCDWDVWEQQGTMPSDADLDRLILGATHEQARLEAAMEPYRTSKSKARKAGQRLSKQDKAALEQLQEQHQVVEADLRALTGWLAKRKDADYAPPQKPAPRQLPEAPGFDPADEDQNPAELCAGYWLECLEEVRGEEPFNHLFFWGEMEKFLLQVRGYLTEKWQKDFAYHLACTGTYLNEQAKDLHHLRAGAHVALGSLACVDEEAMIEVLHETQAEMNWVPKERWLWDGK